MFFMVRILIGLMFVISGLEKAISPYQNFLYVIQSYDVLPSWAEEATARFFPWMELLAGLFTVLGLWCSRCLKAIALMFAAFIAVVGQALLRGLALGECGCFGELVHVAPQHVIVLDSLMLLLTVALLRHPLKTQEFSLDKHFAQ